MNVNGQFHATAALTPGKEHPILIGQVAGYVLGAVWNQWQREKFLHLTVIEFRSLSPFKDETTRKRK